MVSTAMLQRVPTFALLSEEELQQIVTLCREQTFAEGDWCLRQGDPVQNLYILEQGQVAALFHLPPRDKGRYVTIETIRPYQVFGWSSLIPPHEATLSVRCLEPCTIHVLSRDDLHTLFERNSQIGYRVIGGLARIIKERLRRMQEQLVLELGSALLAEQW